MESALHVSSLAAHYGRKPVLDGLSLAPLKAGAITALVGPNGAGKSTLLRALAGLVRTRGSVRLDGDDILAWPVAKRARHVVFMPQALPNGVALSVLESILAGLAVSPPTDDGSRASLEERAIAAMERLGIVHLAMQRLDRLSGGQRQMVALCQAVAREPRVMLLDEPTSALDLRHQEIVMEATRALARDGRIVVVVLHDLALAARWADRIVVLKHGQVAADATPEVALTPQVLADVYGVRATVTRSEAGRLQIDVAGSLVEPARVG